MWHICKYLLSTYIHIHTWHIYVYMHTHIFTYTCLHHTYALMIYVYMRAQEGLWAPLPEGWSEHENEHGSIYYHHRFGVCMHVCMYVCVCVCVYMYIYTNMYICIYIYICECMYVDMDILITYRISSIPHRVHGPKWHFCERSELNSLCTVKWARVQKRACSDFADPASRRCPGSAAWK